MTTRDFMDGVEEARERADRSSVDYEHGSAVIRERVRAEYRGARDALDAALNELTHLPQLARDMVDDALEGARPRREGSYLVNAG